MCFFYTQNQGGGRNDQSGKGSLESRVHSRRLAIYSGVSFGYTLMERRRATVKKKLRIFSQFNERINLTDVSDEERFEIKIPQDIIVEKVRARVEKEDAEERLRAESTLQKHTEIFCEESSNLPTVIPDSDNSHMMT